ncbi:MAG: hypothetical protein QF491_00385 [Alphaproteobacteria bacterium]|nr:hypothetical protein [Alphaproteobacteria bacterium]
MTTHDNHDKKSDQQSTNVSRRTAFKTAGLVAGAAAVGTAGATIPGPLIRPALAQAGRRPLRIGFQVHRTGILRSGIGQDPIRSAGEKP